MKTWKGSYKILKRQLVNSLVFHLDEVVWCSRASISPCLLEVLCQMRECRINLVVRKKQSENSVLFSNFFPRYFNLFSFAKSWWDDLERIMPVVLGILRSLLHAVWRTCCFSQKIRNRMEIYLGCAPVSFLKPYSLWALPFSLWFLSLPSHHAPLQQPL